MNRIQTFLLILFAQSVWSQTVPKNLMGEKNEYKLKYGWFTVGKGSISFNDKFYYEKDLPTVRVKAEAKTAGLGGIFTDFDANFISRVNSRNSQPVFSYRNILSKEMADKRSDRYVFADTAITIKTFIEKGREHKERQIDTIDHDLHDVLSSFVRLRTMDFANMKKGDQVHIHTFYSNTA